MQWLKRIIHQDGDTGEILRETPADRWQCAGPTTCARMTRIWATGSLEPIFVTVGFNLAYKYQICQWFPEGMVFERSVESHEEFLLVKPHEDEIATVVTAYVNEIEDGKVEIQVYKVSGAEILNVTWRKGVTWWKVASELWDKNRIPNLKILRDNVEVYRQWWFRSVLETEYPEQHPGFIWEGRDQMQLSDDESNHPYEEMRMCSQSGQQSRDEDSKKPNKPKKPLKEPKKALKRPSAAAKPAAKKVLKKPSAA